MFIPVHLINAVIRGIEGVLRVIKKMAEVEQPVDCTGTSSLKYSGAVHRHALLFHKGFDFLSALCNCFYLLSISVVNCNSCLPDLSIPVGGCDVCHADLFPGHRTHSDLVGNMNKTQLIR